MRNSGAADASVAAAEARREPRFPMTASVRVGWVDSQRQMKYMTGQGLNISERGLAARLPVPLPASALVHLDVGGCGMSAVGRVRYCLPDGPEWRAGFEVINSFPSDATAFPAE